MRLWDFIDSKLQALGKNESWLINAGISQMTINRIRHGGVIKDSTKQKLALALGCSAGDINEALSRREQAKDDHTADAPETVPVKPEALEPEVKAVVDEIYKETDKLVGRNIMNPDQKEEPVKVKTLKWYMDQPALDLPEQLMSVGEYKDLLLGICLKHLCAAAEANVKDADEIYKGIGRALIRELMK